MKTWEKVLIVLVLAGAIYYFYSAGYFGSASTAPSATTSGGGSGLPAGMGGGGSTTPQPAKPGFQPGATQGSAETPSGVSSGTGQVGVTTAGRNVVKGTVTGPGGKTFTVLDGSNGASRPTATPQPTTPGYHVAPAPAGSTTAPAYVTVTQVQTHSHQALHGIHAAVTTAPH